MRLDHVAYRVANRHKTVDFFINAFGYRIQTEFDLDFEDGSKVKCFALEPPEKIEGAGFICKSWPDTVDMNSVEPMIYHLAPEIFVSDGTPDSIVGKWVAKRDGVGGIHHLAYQVDSVQAQMDNWREKGYAEFTTQSPLTCPDLVQCFTKPSELTGVIYEFIERGAHGFCRDNVKSLMESTRDIEVKTDATL
jgi:catechol 2,3-dioxygenase-like lactoylglutathione lyase family enzyme